MADPLIVRSSPELPTGDGHVRRIPQGAALVRGTQVAPNAPDITDLKKMFDEARSTLDEPRKEQGRDRYWYDAFDRTHGQLSSDVRATLKMRGQPEIYTNRIRPAIDGLLGVLEGSRVDPRAYPRNPGDEDAADVATKTLQYIADVARFDETKIDCAENFFIEGECAVIIEGDQQEITVKQIRWEEFFYDPRSRRSDFKDATYLGFAKWISIDTVAGLYEEQWKAFGSHLDNGIGLEESWADRPDDMPKWVDRKNRRALIVTLFYQKQGQWLRCVYCGAGVLDHGPTGYIDDKGRSLCPIEASSCYVDSKNRRYGRVRDMIPIQDEINARRSRLLHLANSRQIQEREVGAAQVDEDTARAEAARADGIIPPGWMLVPTADLAAGQQILLAESKNEIDRMGPTPAVLGRQDGANQSGRSRLVLQQAGLTELARPMGRFNDWENWVYRQMWWRAKQLWDAPMWVRVTDDLNAPQFVQVNEPVMGPGMVQAAPGGNPMTDPMGQPVMVMGIVQVGAKNRLADLDMDIIVETVPEQANLQSEVFADMIELVRGGLDPFSPQFELLIEMSPLADKARILEKVRKHREQQAEGMAAQAQADEAERAAKIENMQAKTAETEVDTMVKSFQAGFGTVNTAPANVSYQDG